MATDQPTELPGTEPSKHPKLGKAEHALFGAGLKIQRAGEQYRALRVELKAFFDSKPYRFETRVDPQMEAVIEVLRVDRDFPVTLAPMVGEILHNLRSALDYVVHELVVLETNAPPHNSSKVQFPIFVSKEGFESRRGVPTMLKGVGAAARAIIELAQPFATGEGEASPLWVLSYLSNRDKHRSLRIVNAVSHNQASGGTWPFGGVLLFDLPNGIKDETPVAGVRVLPGPEPFLERAKNVRVEAEMSIQPTLGEPPAVKGVNLDKVIDIIGSRVWEVTKRIADEVFPA